MIPIKDSVALRKMGVAGQALAQILEQEVQGIIKPGLTTLEIDQFIEKKMIQAGLVAACKGYVGYKHATCISLNDVVIHGIPSDKVVLKSGDFVKIDVVGSFKGYCADITRYFFIEKVSQTVEKMAKTAQLALDESIKLIAPGVYLSDISACIQRVVEKEGFGVVRDFAGHGVGKRLHEEPEIPNFGRPGEGPILREGMTLAIEPMITQGSIDVRVMPDGWTVKTVDGGLSAHVEDTVAVVKGGARVLTRLTQG